MSNIYCGVDKVPNGKKRGTMKECAELGQIRYYGQKKIDPRTLAAAKSKKSVPETRENLIKMLAGLNGEINRYKGRYENTKDGTTEGKKKKAEYHKLWKAAETKKVKVTQKLRKVLADAEKLKAASKSKKKTASKSKSKSKGKKKAVSKSKSKGKKKTATKSKSKGKKKVAPKRKTASKGKGKRKTVSKRKTASKSKRKPAAKRTGAKGKATKAKTKTKSKSKGRNKRVGTKRKTASKKK